MADFLTREYNLQALTAAGAGLPATTLRMPSNVAMQSVTVDNASNCDAGVWVNRDPGGPPSFVVPAGTYKTQPIYAQILGLSFNPPVGDQPRGQAYVQCTDTPLSASSGLSGSAATSAVWDSSYWDTNAKLGA